MTVETNSFVAAEPIKEILPEYLTGLAQLTGVSDKQIAYGTQQRAMHIQDACNKLNSKIRMINMRIDENTAPDSRIRKIGLAYKKAFQAKMLFLLKNHRDASWWIDNQYTSSSGMATLCHTDAYLAEEEFRASNPHGK